MNDIGVLRLSDYNYPIYDLPMEMEPFELFPHAPNAVEKAPGYPLEDLDSS